jgi:hypothetical protein
MAPGASFFFWSGSRRRPAAALLSAFLALAMSLGSIRACKCVSG